MTKPPSVDIATAALGRIDKASPAISVSLVRHLAAEVGWSPRQVDKLIYIACSNKFYLAGLKPSKRDVDGRKRNLIAALSAMPSSRRPRAPL